MIFRIKVSMPGKPRFTYAGIFLSGFDAAVKAMGDWPEATGISAIHINGSAS